MKDEELRAAGLKVTTPRLKILSILQKANPHHLSAEDVHTRLLDEGDDVGLATVYRVLTQFATAGLVKRHNFEGGFAVFELDDGKHHDHLVCAQCGHVVEFVDPEIETRQKEISVRENFLMTDHALTIYGICKQCQNTK